MKTWKGLYLPDREEHLIEWMDKINVIVDGKPTYQYHKYQAAMRFVHNKKRAIDIGANLGFWSRVMTLDFEAVEAFEPVAEYRECLNLNAPSSKVVKHAVALGDKEGVVSMACSTENSCGNSYVAPDGSNILETEVPMRTLDSYGFQDVGFIKIDNEGYEYFGLVGSEETIKRCKPVVIVEQKPGNAQKFGLAETAAVELLTSWGMTVQQVISGDYILVF